MASLLDTIITDLTGIGTGPDLSADMTQGLGAFRTSFAEDWGAVPSTGGIFADLPQMAGEPEPLAKEPAADPAPAQQQQAPPPANWQQAAQQPPQNLQAVQQQNAQMLSNRPASTSRYYTRKLYREMLRSSDPETRIQARLGLRFRGADSKAAADQYVSNRRATMSTTGNEAGPNAEKWREFFPNRPGQSTPPPTIQRQQADNQAIIDNIMRMTDAILRPPVV